MYLTSEEVVHLTVSIRFSVMGDDDLVRVVVNLYDDSGVVVAGKLAAVVDHLDEVDEYFLGDMAQIVHVTGLQKPPEKEENITELIL